MDFFDNEQVGKRLRHLRCIMDISVSEMADSLGVTTGHFRKWERGDHAISLVGLDMLHRLYGMDLNYLITGKVREQDFANASHSESAKSAVITVSYGIFSSENSYP